MKKINPYVNDKGIDVVKKRFFSKIDMNGPIPERKKCSGPCWIWNGVRKDSKNAYGYLMHNKTSIMASRLSWYIHNGIIPDGMCVLHKCDTPPCCNPKHLFLGTKKDNAQDALKKGRLFIPFGEDHVESKLTCSDVRIIRKLWLAGKYLKDIASKFNVSKSNIWYIVHGKTWAHLKSSQ